MTTRTSGLCLALIIVILSTLFFIPGAGAITLMKEYLNTNLPGGDYATIAAATRDDCANDCVFDAPCRAATWESPVGGTPVCHLKNTVPPVTPYTSLSAIMHSYIKQTDFTITTTATGCPLLPAPPVFTVVPSEGAAPLTVTVADQTNGITRAFWDFGDGSTSTGGPRSGLSHTYASPGSYTLRLTVFDACGQEVSLAREIAVYPPSPGSGSIRIITTPANAMVYIDGSPLGESPVASSLAAGTHRIRIVLAGYADYSSDEAVTAGQELTLRVTLTPSSEGIPYQSPPAASTPDGSLRDALKTTATPAAGQGSAGTLVISSNPAGANAYLDGMSQGKTPVTIPGVSAGQHTVLLTLQGYTDVSRAIDISPGAENQVAVDMPAVKKTPGFAAAAGVLALALLVFFCRKTG